MTARRAKAGTEAYGYPARVIAAVFPGQGSQRPGMGKDLVDRFPEAAKVFDDVAEATGEDLRELCFDAPEEVLRETQNAQLALFTASVAAYRTLDASAISAMAGHSVGEFAALVCADALLLADGARLVQRRGRLMAESGRESPGTMAAILGLDRSVVETVLGQVLGVVVIANDNCPGQVVISGEVPAVRAAGEAAKLAGAKRVLPLNVSGAFHSPLMAHAAEQMADALRATRWRISRVPVYSNVTSRPVDDPQLYAELLTEQLRAPVRWTETVQHMVEDGVTEFVECGPGDVLAGLIRRVSPNAQTAAAGGK